MEQVNRKRCFKTPLFLKAWWIVNLPNISTKNMVKETKNLNLILWENKILACAKRNTQCNYVWHFQLTHIICDESDAEQTGTHSMKNALSVPGILIGLALRWTVRACVHVCVSCACVYMCVWEREIEKGSRVIETIIVIKIINKDNKKINLLHIIKLSVSSFMYCVFKAYLP